MATCAAELLFFQQVLQSLGFKMDKCLVNKSTKDVAGTHVPTLFSDSTVALGNTAKPNNWLMKTPDLFVLASWAWCEVPGALWKL